MNFSAKSKTCRWIALALRVILGALFILAAYMKLQDSWRLFAMDIAAYKVLPTEGPWLELVARTLPWFEAALGVWLISGIWLRVSAGLSAAMMVGFIGLMIWAQVKHLDIDCGCFGPGEKISWITMLRDGSLMAAALALAAWSYLGRKKGSDPIY
jgi:uncharacterized membrane protein YphA (DoxX/SURF4 family)